MVSFKYAIPAFSRNLIDLAVKKWVSNEPLLKIFLCFL